MKIMGDSYFFPSTNQLNMKLICDLQFKKLGCQLLGIVGHQVITLSPMSSCLSQSKGVYDRVLVTCTLWCVIKHGVLEVMHHGNGFFS